MLNEQVIYQFRGPWGVPVQVQSSILLLALIFIGFNLDDPQALIRSTMFFVIVVGSIFLHELGHAWGNVVQGLAVRRVILYGGGGLCEGGGGTNHQRELVVIMGPLVNLALWAMAGLADTILTPIYMENMSWTFYYVIVALGDMAWINLFLFLFNMIPVQPLDGGKLFHLFALRLMDGRLAMRITGAVGLVLSVLWIPGMILMYMYEGWVLFFIPSIAVHLAMFRLEAYRHLKRY